MNLLSRHSFNRYLIIIGLLFQIGRVCALADDVSTVDCISKSIMLDEFKKAYTSGVELGSLDSAPTVAVSTWKFTFQAPNQIKVRYETKVKDVLIESGSAAYPEPKGDPANGQFLLKLQTHNNIGYYQYQGFLLGRPLASFLSGLPKENGKPGDKMLEFVKNDIFAKTIIMTDMEQQHVLYVITIPLQEPNFQGAQADLRSQLQGKGYSEDEISKQLEILKKNLTENKGLADMEKLIKSKPAIVQFDSYKYAP